MSDITRSQARPRSSFATTRFTTRSPGSPTAPCSSTGCESRSRRALRTGDQHAVLFLDLDRFKLINDGFSHAVGDELLVAVARRLDADLRPGDTVARLGGDEFTILLEDIDSPEMAMRGRPSGSTTPFVTRSSSRARSSASRVSIGIAVSESNSEAAELMRNADIAMYAAKAHSEDAVAVFDVSMHSRVVARLQVETELRRVIEERRLAIAYQPIVDLAERRHLRLRGAGALARGRRVRLAGPVHPRRRGHRADPAARPHRPRRRLRAARAIGAARAWSATT